MGLCLLSEQGSQGHIGQDLHGMRQRRRVVCGHSQPCHALGVHGVDPVVELRADDGFAAGHGFELNQAKCFCCSDGRQAKYIAGVVISRQVFIADATCELHFVGQSQCVHLLPQLGCQRTVSPQNQIRVGVLHRFDQHVKAFVAHVATERENEQLALGLAADLRCPLGNAGGELQSVVVHAKRDDVASLCGVVCGDLGAAAVVGCSGRDQGLCTHDFAALKWAVKLEQVLLFDDVAVPGDHAWNVGGHAHGHEVAHGVWKVQVDQVKGFLLVQSPCLQHHGGADGCAEVHAQAGGFDHAVAVDRLVGALQCGRCNQVNHFNALGGECLAQGLCVHLHTTNEFPEAAELEYAHEVMRRPVRRRRVWL